MPHLALFAAPLFFWLVLRLFPGKGHGRILTGLPRQIWLAGLVFTFANQPKTAVAQQFTGRVVNELGTGVPFALISSPNQAQALITDMNGYFAWPRENTSLMVRQPDFVAKHYVIGADSAQRDTLYFYLGARMPEQVNMTELVAGKEIIRKVLRRKPVFSPVNYAFTYTAYHKLTVSAMRLQDPGILRKLAGRFFELFKDFGSLAPHLFMMESVTTRKHYPKLEDEEKIIATNATGLSQTSLLTPSTTLQPFNLFQNFFELPSYRFISPLANHALKRYQFRLSDSVFVDSSWVYLIEFKPRRFRNFDGIEGYLYVQSGTFAPVAVYGRESRQTSLPLLFAQQFRQLPNGAIFPEVLRIKFELLTASKARTVYVAELTSYLKDLQATLPAAQVPFNPIVLSSRGAADVGKTSFWQVYRGNTFTPEDGQTLAFYDSLGVRKKANRTLLIAEKLRTGTLPIFFLDMNLHEMLRYNEHEGFRPGLSLTTNNRFSGLFRLGGYAGYGLSDQAWKWSGSAGMKLHAPTNTWLTYSTELQVEEAGMPQFAFSGSQFNSEWLRNLRVRKMDQIRSQSLQLTGRYLRDLELQLHVARGVRKPLYDYVFMPQPDDHYRFSEAAVGLRYAFRERFIETQNLLHSIGTRYPVLSVQASKGIKGVAGGELGFWKLDGKVSYQLRTLAAGVSSFQFIGGFVTGSVPYGLLFNGKGSLRIPSVVIHNSFETMRYNEFLSDRYAALFFSHQFGKSLLRLKGFEPTFEVVHNMGVGALRNPQSHQGIDVKQMRKGYFESGFFINDLIAFRVYLLKSSVGTGFLFRYGPYSFRGFEENAYFKLSLRIGI